MVDPTMSPAPDVRLEQQVVWLIRRCRQLRSWLSFDRPDVVQLCVSTMAQQDLDQMRPVQVVQACQAMEQALRSLGCPRLIWASQPSAQTGPWIGCAPRLGWFILHARQPDGHWLIETVNGAGRHAEWPEHARITALPLAAGWQQHGSMRALVWHTLLDNREIGRAHV